MFKRAAQFVRQHQRIAIVSHTHPDPDALGSSLALALGLQQLGKEITVLNGDPVPANLQFLPGSQLVQQQLDSPIDALIVVDVARNDRIGEAAAEQFDTIPTYIIDHHKTTAVDLAQHTIDPNVAATAVLIYHVLAELGVELNAEIATNLYSGLIGDTGDFRYANTSAEVLEMAAHLVRAGAQPAHITQSLYDQRHPAELKLLVAALGTLELDCAGQFAHLSVSQAMFQAAGATEQHADGLANYPRSLAGVEVAVVLRERSDGRWKASVRSQTRVDVAEIARQFDGGGHKHAAGCDFASLEEAQQQLFPAIIQALSAS